MRNIPSLHWTQRFSLSLQRCTAAFETPAGMLFVITLQMRGKHRTEPARWPEVKVRVRTAWESAA